MKRGFEDTPRGHGRGPIDHATKVTPVRRGPPPKPWKTERGANAAPRGQAKGHAKGAPGARPDPRVHGRTKPDPNAKVNPNPAPGAKSRTGARSKAVAKPQARAKPNGGTKLKGSAPAGGVNRLAQPPPAPQAGADAVAPGAGKPVAADPTP